MEKKKAVAVGDQTSTTPQELGQTFESEVMLMHVWFDITLTPFPASGQETEAWCS